MQTFTDQNYTKYYWVLAITISLLACNQPPDPHSTTSTKLSAKDLQISSSHEALVEVFNWAKEKARFYVQTGK